MRYSLSPARHTLLAATAFAATAPLASAATESVVFDQFTDLFTNVAVGSNTNANPDRNWRSFDNLVLTKSAQITGVDWRGILDQRYSEDGVQHTHVNEIVGFQVTFYQSTAGAFGTAPGAVVSNQLILSANVTETNFGSNAQSFSAQLNEAVSLEAGTEYWFSVAAVLPNPDGAVLLWYRWWGLQPLPAGDAFSLYDVGTDGSIDGSRPADLLFRLRGVPAPGATTALLATALIAARRRR